MFGQWKIVYTVESILFNKALGYEPILLALLVNFCVKSKFFDVRIIVSIFL